MTKREKSLEQQAVETYKRHFANAEESLRQALFLAKALDRKQEADQLRRAWDIFQEIRRARIKPH